MCLAAGNGRASVKVLPLDLNDFASLPSKVEEAISLFDSPIDILVNNGGITTRSLATNATFGVDERVIRVDFLAYVLLTKCLLKSCWERQEMKTNPIIINTTSVAGKIGLPVRTAYCGAKHALHGWFDSLRMEQSIINGKPIHILNVVLGSTRTNIARNAITSNPETKFGDDTVDMNIESGLDPNFVVERVVAVAYARQDEIWIAPRKELLVLYLSQYFPEMAKKLISKKFAKQYAVQGSKEKKL
jgi:short-subunit dehydrogenase